MGSVVRHFSSSFPWQRKRECALRQRGEGEKKEGHDQGFVDVDDVDEVDWLNAQEEQDDDDVTKETRPSYV